jgi:hypothetical protein
MPVETSCSIAFWHGVAGDRIFFGSRFLTRPFEAFESELFRAFAD